MKTYIVHLIITAVLASLPLPAEAQVLGWGFGGTLGGAALGSLVGGRKGAQTGAIIGGAVGQSAPGVFLFTDTAATNWPHRFYRVTYP